MTDDLGSRFEELLVDLKGNGRYQWITFFLVLLPTFFACSFISSGWLFVIATPDDFFCHIPLNQSNGTSVAFTSEEKKRLLPPGNDGELHSKCELYSVDYSALLQNFGSIREMEAYFNATNASSTPRTACSSWEFDKTVYQDTITTDWDLVCTARDFLPTLAYIIGSIGVMIGTPLGGYAADRFGRKPTYFAFLALQVVFGAATVAAPRAHYGYYVFLTLYTIHSVSVNPIYLVPSTLGLEIITPDCRATFLVLLTLAYTAGAVAFTGIAYALRSWRPMVLATILPFTLYGMFWFVLPESPRWLLLKGRSKEFNVYLRKMAKINRVEWSESLEGKASQLCIDARGVSHISLSNLNESSDVATYSYLDLFRGPRIRRHTILMLIMSIVVQVCYYGLGYYAPTLGPNPYLSFFLSSLVEIPGALLIQLVCDRIGRRLTILLCFIAGGTACLSTLAVPPSSASFGSVLGLFLVAKLFITAAYAVQELLVNELLPTVVRGKGVALTNFVSSLFANIGPIIVYSGRADSESLTLVIFGGLMIFASICALFIPETLDRPLPETLAECETMDLHGSWKDTFAFCRPTVKSNHDQPTMSTSF
ncbi:Carcinine [Hypsibius exemplaris]|uniref:Carcinine n=1 Tax=Hypsibius exemplaris TaxID=2072580 RepID=A0A9X6RNK8_HYPEX|nr:Carcinine [Hypsibius exemplaris]